MEKNHILFFVLSALIFIVYYFFVAPKILPNQQERRNQAEKKSLVEKSSSISNMAGEESKSSRDVLDGTEAEKVSPTRIVKSLDLAISESSTIAVQPKKYEIRLPKTIEPDTSDYRYMSCNPTS